MGWVQRVFRNEPGSEVGMPETLTATGLSEQQQTQAQWGQGIVESEQAFACGCRSHGQERSEMTRYRGRLSTSYWRGTRVEVQEGWRWPTEDADSKVELMPESGMKLWAESAIPAEPTLKRHGRTHRRSYQQGGQTFCRSEQAAGSTNAAEPDLVRKGQNYRPQRQWTKRHLGRRMRRLGEIGCARRKLHNRCSGQNRKEGITPEERRQGTRYTWRDAFEALEKSHTENKKQQQEILYLKLQNRTGQTRENIQMSTGGPRRTNSHRDVSRASESSSAMATPTMSPPQEVSQDGPPQGAVTQDYQRIRMLGPMPQPLAQGSPHFSGKNISEFLKAYENLCDDWEVSGLDRVRKVVRYCDRLLGTYIENVDSYIEKDWDRLKKDLLREYRSTDVDQQMESVGFLQRLKSKVRTERDDVRHYAQQFAAIANKLAVRGEIGSYERVTWFLQGLPAKMTERVVRGAKLDPTDPSSLDFSKAYTAVISQIQAEEAMEAFRNPSPKREEALGELADKMERPKMKDGEWKWDPSAQTVVADPVTKSDGMAELTKNMGALALTMQAQQSVVNSLAAQMMTAQSGPRREGGSGYPEEGYSPPSYQPAVHSVSQTHGARGYQRQNLPQGDPAREQIHGRDSQGRRLCFTCGSADDQAGSCNWEAEATRQGRIHRNERNRICLGRLRPNAQEVYKPRDKYMKDAVEAAEAQQAQRAQQEQPGNAQVRYIHVDFLDSEPELPPVEEDAGVVGVYQTLTRPAAGRDRVFRKGAQVQPYRVRKEGVFPDKVEQAMERERQYPSLRSQRDGEYEDAPAPPDTEMEGIPTAKGRNGHATRVKGQRTLRQHLRSEYDPHRITEQILDMPVTLPARQVLGVPEVNRAFFSSFAAPEDPAGAEAVVNQIEAMSGSEELEDKPEIDNTLMIAGTPQARVIIGKREMSAMLDSGAEVCVIDEQLGLELGLVISENVSLTMLGAGGGKSDFVGVIENALVTVGNYSVRVPIWLAKNFKPKLILGRTYFVKARLTLADDGDGKCYATIKSADGKNLITWLAVGPNASAHLTRGDLIASRSLNAPADI